MHLSQISKNSSIISYFLALTVLFITVLGGSGDLWAQTRDVAVEVGKTNSVVFAPGETTKTINLQFFSSYTTTSTVSMSLAVPNGSVISGKSLGFGKTLSLADAASQIKNGTVQEVSLGDGTFRKSVTVGTTTSTSNSEQFFCDGYVRISLKPAYITDFIALYNREPTSDTDLCDGLFGNDWHQGGDGSSANFPSGSAVVTSFSIKDACIKPVKSIQVFSIDLKKITAAERAAGFTISIDLSENVYTGGMQGTLKPKSDGKFSPNPLLLTEMVDGAAQPHSYMRFSSGSTRRQLSNVKKAIVNYIAYNGLYFAASLPADQLTGGKMTVVSKSSQHAYGLCFKAVRSRQNLNGYHNN